MKKPDFFFIGAPKCGTTALTNWLRDHPRIFMSQNPKEPMFFDSDIYNVNRMSLEQYEHLFREADEIHQVVGEASTTYLRSHDAIRNILSYSPAARFLVAVRNPIEMAPSVHSQLVYTQYEDLVDFKQAWLAQEDRAQGRRLPVNSRNEAARLMYKDVCRLGNQVERLYRQVPRERVMIVFMDDMKADPRKVYMSVLRFLGVPDDNRMEFPRVNVRKRTKLQILGRILMFAGRTKRRLGLQGVHTGLFSGIHDWNRVAEAPVGLDESFRQELVACFEEDICLLGKLTGRDLSAWLR